MMAYANLGTDIIFNIENGIEKVQYLTEIYNQSKNKKKLVEEIIREINECQKIDNDIISDWKNKIDNFKSLSLSKILLNSKDEENIRIIPEILNLKTDMNEEIESLNSLLDSALENKSIELKNVHSFEYLKDCQLWINRKDELIATLSKGIELVNFNKENIDVFVKETSSNLLNSSKGHTEKYELLREAFNNVPILPEEKSISDLQEKIKEINTVIDKEHRIMIASFEFVDSLLEQINVWKNKENEFQKLNKVTETIKEDFKSIRTIKKDNQLPKLSSVKEEIELESSLLSELIQDLNALKEGYVGKELESDKLESIYNRTCINNIDFLLCKSQELTMIIEQLKIQHKAIMESYKKEAYDESDRRCQYWLAWCQQQCNVLAPNYEELLKPLTRKHEFDFNNSDLTMFDGFKKGINIRKSLKHTVDENLKKFIHDIGDIYNEMKVSETKEGFSFLAELLKRQTSTLESLVMIENFTNSLVEKSNQFNTKSPMLSAISSCSIEDKELFENEMNKFNEVLEEFKNQDELKNLVKDQTLLSQFQAQSEKVLSDYEKLDELNQLNQKKMAILYKLSEFAQRLNDINASLEGLDPRNTKRVKELISEYEHITLSLEPIEKEWNEAQQSLESLDPEATDIGLDQYAKFYKLLEEIRLNLDTKKNGLEIDNKIKELKKGIQDFLLAIKKVNKVVDSNTSFLKDLEAAKTKLDTQHEMTETIVNDSLKYFEENRIKDSKIDIEIETWVNIDIASLKKRLDERIGYKQQMQADVQRQSKMRSMARTLPNKSPGFKSQNSSFNSDSQDLTIIDEDETLILPNHYIPDTKSELDLKIANIINTCNTQVEIKRDDDKGKYWIGGKLVFCRILNSNLVMVRVGGGWCELSTYLKNVLCSFALYGVSKSTDKCVLDNQYTIDSGEIVISNDLFSNNTDLVRRNRLSSNKEGLKTSPLKKTDAPRGPMRRPNSSISYRAPSPTKMQVMIPNIDKHVSNGKQMGHRHKRSITPGPRSQKPDF